MVRAARRFTAAAIAGAILGAEGAAGQCPDAWTTPERLGRPPRGAALHYEADLALGPGGGFVTGIAIRSPFVPAEGWPLTITSLEGTELPPPPGDFTFLAPESDVDPAGVLHVVWGEPTVRRAVTIEAAPFDLTVGSLWYAHYAPADGWSAPEMIAADTAGFVWTFAPEAALVAGARSVHVAVVASHANLSHRRLLHLERSEQGWTSRAVFEGFTHHPSVTTFGDRTYIAWLAPDSAGGKFSARILAIDGDGTLASTRLRLGDVSVQGLHAVAFDAGVHVIARVRSNESSGRPLLRHALWADDGEPRWAGDFALPGEGQETAPVVDACGVLHMLFLPELRDFRSEVWHLRWHGSWRTPITLESGFLSASATLAAGPGGEVWAAWLRTRDTDPATMSLETVVSRLVMR